METDAPERSRRWLAANRAMWAGMTSKTGPVKWSWACVLSLGLAVYICTTISDGPCCCRP